MSRLRVLTLVCVWAVLGAMPAPLRAETLYLRNDTTSTIIVQASCVVRGMVQRDRPIQLQPGGLAAIKLPGDKLINIHDAKLLRPIYQGTIPATVADQYYTVEADGNKAKLSPSAPFGGK